MVTLLVIGASLWVLAAFLIVSICRASGRADAAEEEQTGESIRRVEEMLRAQGDRRERTLSNAPES